MARVYRSIESRAHGLVGFVWWEYVAVLLAMGLGYLFHFLAALVLLAGSLGGLVVLRAMHGGRRNWLEVRLRMWLEPRDFCLAEPEATEFRGLRRSRR